MAQPTTPAGLVADAQTLNEVINGDGGVNRAGDTLPSIKSIIGSAQNELQDAISRTGYNFIGEFTDGATIESRVDSLRFDGEWYRWDGALPKTVPAGSTPQDEGGIGTDAWVGVGDAALRNDLSNANGALIVGNSSVTISDVGQFEFLASSDKKENFTYIAEGQQGGRFYYDPERAAENDGGTVFNGFVRVIENGIITSDMFGVQNGEDISPKLSDMIYAAEGAKLVFNPNSIQSLIVDDVAIEDVSVDIDFQNIELLFSDNAQNPIRFNYNHTDVIDVTSVSLTDGKTVLTVADSVSYDVGDVVKVASEDLIPEAWQGTRCIGEWAIVQETTSTTISLDRKLHDHDLYSTGIKVGKHSGKTLIIRNHKCRSATDNKPYGAIRVTGAAQLYMYGGSASKLNSAYARLEGLYKPVVANLQGNNLKMDSVQSEFGYVVADFSCQEGVFYNLTGNNVRHVYTTNSVSTSDFTLNYGRSMNSWVDLGIARDCEIAGWDTHTEAIGITFTNNKTVRCGIGYQSRSVGTKIINPEFDMVGRAFQWGGSSDVTVGINNLKDNVVVNPVGTFTERLFGIVLGSGFDGDPTVRGPVSIIDANMRRVGNESSGSGLLGQCSHPVDFSLSGQIAVEESTNLHLMRFNAEGNKVSIPWLDLNVLSNPTDNIHRLAFCSGDTAETSVVDIGDLTIRGDNCNVRNIVQGMNLRIKSYAIQDVSAFNAQDGEGELLTWAAANHSDVTP